LALKKLSAQHGLAPFIAFLLPIAMLILIKYVPPALNPLQPLLKAVGAKTLAVFFVGISYVAFRLSHLVMEVRNRVVPCPSFWEYLGYAFFVPIVSIGPISPYSVYRATFARASVSRELTKSSFARVLLGFTKYLFLATLFNQLSYAGLLLDGHPHPYLDLAIAMVCFYFYLYFNFSGYCDMAIGTAGLLGIEVRENFNNPFAARNMREFWNRWHITLSTYMRDMVFSPLSKALVRVFGPKSTNHVVAVAIMCVFLLIGIWHGVGWHYMAFGFVHGLGVMANHYYTLILKKRLGKAGFAAYNRNVWIHAAAVGATFIFVSASLFLFANSAKDTLRIIRAFD